MEKRAVSRRDFLRIGGGAGAGLFFIGQIGGQLFEVPVAAAADPGRHARSRRRAQVPDAAADPPGDAAGGHDHACRAASSVDYYEISMRQFAQQVLPAGLPATTVWGYGGKAAQSNRGLLVHNAPSLTIEAQYNRPVRVKWINELVDGNGNYLPHLLPVDPTLHWANPPGGTAGRDERPTFAATPGAVHGPGADRHPRPRRRRRRRRERRLRRGLVPARRQQHPGRLRHGGHVVQLLRRQGGDELRRRPGVRASPRSSTRTWGGRRPPGTTTTPWG